MSRTQKFNEPNRGGWRAERRCQRVNQRGRVMLAAMFLAAAGAAGLSIMSQVDKPKQPAGAITRLPVAQGPLVMLEEQKGNECSGAHPTQSFWRQARPRLAVDEGGEKPGGRLRIENRLQGAVFARVLRATGEVATMFILPGDAVTGDLGVGQADVSLMKGRRWCDAEQGWADASPVGSSMQSVDLAEGAVLVMRMDPGMAGRPQIRKRFERAEDVAQGDVALRVEETEGGRVKQGGRWAQRAEELRASVERDGIGEVLDRLGGAVRSMAEEATGAADEADGEVLQVQDWRDVPARDIRVQRRGKLKMLNGSVGDESVTFLVSSSGPTSIGSDLAEAVGASECVKTGRVLKRALEAADLGGCIRIVPRLSFGSVTLENVAVKVEQGAKTPILGIDMTGPQHMYEGRDGTYMRVGKQ